MAENKKVYGLILPKKTPGQENKQKTSTFNVFGDESDEEEKVQGPVGPYGQVTKANTKMKRQTQMDIEKAIQEDPSVYEYDNIYDDMQAAKPKVGCGEKKKQAIDRKPKYIADLLKASEVKKKEDERRKERQVQKEREAEGEKFADKESFVTSAYKKKMLEMQEEEEKERKKAELEALTDVTKQKDMSGFYRYLYHQTTKSEVEPQVKKEIKQESDSQEAESISHGRSREPEIEVKEEPKSPESQSDSDTAENPTSNKHSENLISKRLRKRVSSSSSESSPQHRSRSPDSPSWAKSRTPRSASPESKKSRSRSPRNKKSGYPQPRESKDRRSRSPKQRMHDNKRESEHRQRKRSTERRIQDIADQSEENDKVMTENASHPANKSGKENLQDKKTIKKKTADEVVPPSQKVYPHHNSAKDIQEARKRYLQRKIEREKTYIG